MQSFFVQHLPIGCRPEQIFEAFGAFGQVASSSIYFANRGCAFVDFTQSLDEVPRSVSVDGHVVEVLELGRKLNSAVRLGVGNEDEQTSPRSKKLGLNFELPIASRRENKNGGTTTSPSARASNKVPTLVRVAQVPPAMMKNDGELRKALLKLGKVLSIEFKPRKRLNVLDMAQPLMSARFSFEGGVPPYLVQSANIVVDENEYALDLYGSNTVIVGPFPASIGMVAVSRALQQFGNVVSMTKLGAAVTPVPTPAEAAAATTEAAKEGEEEVKQSTVECHVLFEDLNAAKRAVERGILLNGVVHAACMMARN